MKTPFNAQALSNALDAFFDEPRTEVVDVLERYHIDASFGGKELNVRAGAEMNCPYWKLNVRPERFQTTSETGLLYRPKIVNEIVLKIEGAMEAGLGVMVDGPHGVGKSHSLVNVVRKLESTGNYLVTFVPNCEIWNYIGDLYDAMCGSFGSTRKELKVKVGNHGTKMDKNLKHFVNAVDKILTRRKKTWVLVFDQVNKLLPSQPEKSDLSSLAFPFNQIGHLILKGRRTCVISTSGSSEARLSDGNGGFVNYRFDHPLSMDEDELRLAFLELKGKSDTYVKHIIALTGGVPLQVHLRLFLERNQEVLTTSMKLNEKQRISTMEIDDTIRQTLIEDYGENFPSERFTSDMEIDTFLRANLIDGLGKEFPMPSIQNIDVMYKIGELDRISLSLYALKRLCLRDTDTWKSIVESVMSCLTQVKVKSLNFDRGYSILDDPTEGGQFPERVRIDRLYKPVHPLVLEGYEEFFWDDIMDFVDKQEGLLLGACSGNQLTNDAKDRIFRLLVIRRCGLGEIALGNPNVPLPKQSRCIKRFDGDDLPRIYDDEEEYVTFVPRSCTFPAIDLIWKNGNDVWGVQVHVNTRESVFAKFKQMCEAAEWHTNMDNVYLLYLSPEMSVGNLVDKGWPNMDETIKVQVLCCKDVACLKTLRWPHQCTLSEAQKQGLLRMNESDDGMIASLLEDDNKTSALPVARKNAPSSSEGEDCMTEGKHLQMNAMPTIS